MLDMQAKQGGLNCFSALICTSCPVCGMCWLCHIFPQKRWAEQEWKSELAFWFVPCDVCCSHFNTGCLVHGETIIAGVGGTRGLKHFFTSY